MPGGAPAKGSTGRIAAQRTLDQALEPVNSRAHLGQDAAKRLNALDLFSIGSITTQTAERLGLRVAGTSAEQTIESLVAMARAYYAPPGDADA